MYSATHQQPLGVANFTRCKWDEDFLSMDPEACDMVCPPAAHMPRLWRA
jgi:hypothetical protein